MGALFGKFLPKLGFPVLLENDFNNYKDIAFLDGSDSSLKNYAVQKLGYTSNSKGLDIIAKSGTQFIIGEAKFLTDLGGHQNAQFADAMTLLKHQPMKNTKQIAILDGVVWIKSNNKMHKNITSLANDEIVLSALLLKKLLESFR